MENKSRNDKLLPSKSTFIYRYIALLLSLIMYFFAACSLRINKKEEKQNEKLQQEFEVEKQQQKMDEALKEKQKKDKKENEEDKNKVKDNVFLEDTNVGGLSKEEVLKIIKQKAAKIEKEPVNARYDSYTWEVIPGKMGAKVNVEKTLKSVMDAKEGKKVKLVVEEIEPEITRDSYKDKIVIVSSFSTPLVDKTPNRIHNIKLAINKIRNKVIYPNEEFSFNNAVGNRTPEQGYKSAIIIRRTKDGPKKEQGIGGGVCQLSTTIYKAAQAGGFKITERHDHSDDVTYAEMGEDAAVSFGYLDFKFINNKSFPIMLKFSMDENQLTVTIVGNKMVQ